MAKELSMDEIERAHCRSRRMFEMDLMCRLVVARDNGIEEGRRKGREEAREEARAKAREEARAKAREEAREEGIEKGIEEARRATAKKMLNLGISVELVAQATGLSREEVENLHGAD